MDHEHILALVEAVHGAHGDAIHGFAANAAFVDDESQFSTPNTLERATLAKKVVPYTQQLEPVPLLQRVKTRLARLRHSKIADGFPLSVEERSGSGRHCNDGI
jgi:hypothetical protein